MQRAQPRDDHPVHLLWKWGAHIPGAQPRLHVPNRNPGIESRQRPAQRGGGIALHQNHIRFLAAQYGGQLQEHRAGRFGQRLAAAHDVQIVVRRDLKYAQNLVQHLPVLGRDANPGVEVVWATPKALDHRAEFYGLWASAKNKQDLASGHHSTISTGTSRMAGKSAPAPRHRLS